MWNDLKRYCDVPHDRRRLLREALLSLAVARIAMAFLPFRRVASWLGTRGAHGPNTAAPDAMRIAEEIGWAVGVLGPRVPWDGRCLAQAIAATKMLRRRGLEGTVSFGVSEGQSAAFDAHAWLRFGSVIVTGGHGLERFKTLTTFFRRPS